MAIAAHYQKDMAIALPGMVADTSRYNIDGACVLNGDVDILVGVAVQVESAQAVDGHKLMKPMATGGKAYGVAIRSHFQTKGKDGQMYYEAGGGINVMTSGRVWVISKDANAPAFGDPVKFDVDGKQKADGAIETAWTYAGGFTTYQDLKLVEIQLHQL